MRSYRLFSRKQNNIIFAGIVLICLVSALAARFNNSGSTDIPDTDYDGSYSVVDADPSVIPEYSGEDYIVLNQGNPNFNEWDLENITGEHYSELDSLGRCGSAYALLDRTMMPTEKRGKIGQIKPTGWVQKKYEGIVDSDPPYLYNRCHLIAYALTGQNANERNLITGTRYMNAETMLPWEEKVMRYLDDSPNHVLYRVTPYFQGDELVARGVEMEAYSVEDSGEGLCFHVFVYNVQPGIEIDYLTGESACNSLPRSAWIPE
jgi:DNA-entry nuclease